ncbi:hypothetical protein BT96DRAFT_701381 [Gymnopus androsaceus JB14]|uniref:Uncharacterized protein n=1 Tax=Gymnopus androsaceus JB14 TaxID=1447944 RepID=A0A6A4IEU5_9AGAR|nr:hypothetical protein BT96DRAFT_701381 [Gymnopus androsaceus JB14]
MNVFRARLVLRQVISYTPEYSILMKHFQSCQTNDGHESGSGTGTAGIPVGIPTGI